MNPPHDHGTRARYNRGCRCDPCRVAQSAWAHEYRARRPKGIERDLYDIQKIIREEMRLLTDPPPGNLELSTEHA